MSNYSNTFGGAAKDSSQSLILASDHDTEYDNIATMSTTKADKAVPSATNNLTTLSASGNIQDSGYQIDDNFPATSATITPASDADVTLTAAQELNHRLVLVDGSWTATHNIIVSTTKRTYFIDNTSGTYTATIKTSAGTGISVSSGYTLLVYYDGTNVIVPENSLSDGTNNITKTNLYAGSAKAWVNFDSTGTIAIRDSFNVTSITDNGVGDYTLNFVTSFPDTNYSPVVSYASGVTSVRVTANLNVFTTSDVRIKLFRSDTGAADDSSTVTTSIFSN